MAVEATNVSIKNEQAVTTYLSSAWASRGFCSQCGTHLFYWVDQDNQYFIPVGIFEGDIDFEFARQIYIDQKPDYYCFADQTLDIPGAALDVAEARDK